MSRLRKYVKIYKTLADVSCNKTKLMENVSTHGKNGFAEARYSFENNFVEPSK